MSDVITTVQDVFAAYRSLVGRCCSGVTVIDAEECVVPSLWSVLREVRALVAGQSCRSLHSVGDISDPGDPSECLTAEWINDLREWIDSLVCDEVEPDTCPDESCYQYVVYPYPEAHRIVGTPGSCYYSDGTYTLTWNEETQQWDLSADGSLYATGSRARHDPSGSYSLGGTVITITPCVTPNPQAGILTIQYEWTGTGQTDLDSATEYAGNTAGFGCGCGGEMMRCNDYLVFVSGDVQGINGIEVVTLDLGLALARGLWVSSVEIACKAGWYIPQGGSGPAYLRATYNGVSRMITISPGSQYACASAQVGLITVYDNGTFILE